MANQANSIRQFYGVGRQKASRRANGSVGKPAPRKLYAYTRADQRGTAMESFINSNYDRLDQQNNSRPGGPLRDMAHTDASGQLKSAWGQVHKRGTSSSKVRSYLDKHGGSSGRARKALARQHEVSFGADPKSK